MRMMNQTPGAHRGTDQMAQAIQNGEVVAADFLDDLVRGVDTSAKIAQTILPVVGPLLGLP